MTGRIPFGLLTLLTVLACMPIQAQDSIGLPPGPGDQPFGPQANPTGAGSYYGIPLNYQRTPVGGAPGSPPQTVYRELPDDLGFADADTPLGTILKETFRHSWFRTEYLLWNINSPGNNLVGEQTASGVRQTFEGYSTPPANFFNTPNTSISPGMNFTQTVNGVAGTAQSPGLGDFSISNLNGFRGTYGLPLPMGTLELGGFVLATSTNTSSPDSITYPGSLIQGAPQNTINSSGQVVVTDPFWTTGNPTLTSSNGAAYVVTTPSGAINTANGLAPENPHPSTFISSAALLNGQKSDSTFINYDVSYQAKLTTAVWGTEGNFVLNSPDPNSPFQLRPAVGFRYLNFRDRFEQIGQYFSDANRTTIIGRDINAGAVNNLYGPQASIRAEAAYSRFLIGFEPKVMLGLNTWQSNLAAVNVFTPNTSQTNQLNGTTFAPLVDLKLYGNAAISKNLSAYMSYNFLWTGSLARSANDVTYNSPNLILNRQYSTGTMQGLSFGLEIKY